MAGGMAAYVFPNSDSENVVYIGSGGQIRHWVLQRGSGGGWQLDPLSAPQASSGSDIAAYAFPDDNTEHIIYFDDLFNVRELYRHSGDKEWTANALPGPTAWSQVGTSSPLTAYITSDGTEHILYFDQGANLNELWFQPGGSWKLNSGIGSFLGGNNPPIINFPLTITSYIFNEENTQHVAFATAIDSTGLDAGITEASKSVTSLTNSWGLTALTSPPNPVSVISGNGLMGYDTPEDSTQHIIASVYGALWEYYRHLNSKTWLANNLIDPSITIGAPPSPSLQPVAAYYFAQRDANNPLNQPKTEHVVYIGSDRFVYEIYKNVGPPPWNFNNLCSPVNTSGGSNPASPTSPLVGYTWSEDNSEHVIYVDENNILTELYFVGVSGTWFVTKIGAFG